MARNEKDIAILTRVQKQKGLPLTRQLLKKRQDREGKPKIRMAPRAEKDIRKLKIIQAVLTILVLVLAVVLKVVIFLHLQGGNDQLERAKVSNKALKLQNEILSQRISEATIIHGGNLYYFSCGEMSWKDSEQYCVSRESHLTSVTSAEEQDFLYRIANGTYYWIGLKKQNAAGWQWVDGTPYEEAKIKEFWANGKPSNEKEDKDCAHFWAKTRQSWNNYLCTFPFKFICKWNCQSSKMCEGREMLGS
uniref:C-type lectin domain family 4 member K-like n=1 Tax=Monodelphis domestica TaxID=13616 RepID=A0A5F8H1J4_MONDO